MMKYTLQCFDVSGCQASFDRQQLKEILGLAVMEKLDSLQQEDEIRKAGLEGLEDCPFCSYKAVLPPVEEDREFRCENSSCKVVSCRLCKEKSHIPQTCEEYRKDKGLSERHQVEEAMSNALIRKCPKCQLKIIKEYGCNKMQCTKCHTLMCYVCQKDITKEGYAHFGRGGCPQDDIHTQDRDDREIQRAERAAIDKILAENPDMSEEQIRVGHEKPNAQIRGVRRDPRLQPAIQMRDAMRGMRADMGGFYPQQHQHANTAAQRQLPVYPPPAYNVPYPMDYGTMFNPPFPDFNVLQRGLQPGNLPAQPAVMQPMVVGLANPPANFHPQNIQNITAFPPQRLPRNPNAAYRGGGFGPF
jgi:TRIAD3 protein (E3 ubiquitin-protein ligase RNF216)